MGKRRANLLPVLALIVLLSSLVTFTSEVQSASRWVVVVDAGHGGKDPGATGYNGTTEKEINLEIAKIVRILSLSDSQIEVVLTRYDDRFIDLRERINFAERLGADAYISIHANAHDTTAPNGIETVLHDSPGSANYSESLKLAKKLQAQLIASMKSTGVRDRGVKQRALYTRWASMPAVVVETGFVTNPSDATNLTSVWYQLHLGKSILEGIKSYLVNK